MTHIQCVLVKVFILVFLLLACKKDNAPLNIKLKDKPLAVIKSHIQGRWQLHYTFGGFTGNFRQNFTNSSIEFKPTDFIYGTDNDTVWVNNKINWISTTDIFNEATYIMSFNDLRGYPFNWIVDGIYNDTLIFTSNAIEPDSYYLTKEK